jgi:hypothetical protein
VLQDFLEEEELGRPELKVAWIEGDMYDDPEALDTLAELKSREELIGEVIGRLLAPAQNLVGALRGPGQRLSGLLQSLAEEEEEE